MTTKKHDPIETVKAQLRRTKLVGMNCNITILQTFDLRTPDGEYVCLVRVKKGEIFTGTAQSSGRVLFHVTDTGGTIHPVSLADNDPNIEVEMFKNQTSV